jgi:hypothetical protein
VSQALLTALLAQEEGASLDNALTRALKTTRDLQPADRRKVVQSLYEVNRRRARLSWHLTEARSPSRRIICCWHSPRSKRAAKRRACATATTTSRWCRNSRTAS